MVKYSKFRINDLLVFKKVTKTPHLLKTEIITVTKSLMNKFNFIERKGKLLRSEISKQLDKEDYENISKIFGLEERKAYQLTEIILQYKMKGKDYKKILSVYL